MYILMLIVAQLPVNTKSFRRLRALSYLGQALTSRCSTKFLLIAGQYFFSRPAQAAYPYRIIEQRQKINFATPAAYKRAAIISILQSMNCSR